MMIKDTDQKKQNGSSSENKPSCFGDAERVCPKGEEGFIQPRAECIACEWVRLCLQTALRKEGVIPPTTLEKMKNSRVGNFFKRWSDQKISRGSPSKK